jgi:hypothetical protein
MHPEFPALLSCTTPYPRSALPAPGAQPLRITPFTLLTVVGSGRRRTPDGSGYCPQALYLTLLHMLGALRVPLMPSLSLVPTGPQDLWLMAVAGSQAPASPQFP